MLFAAVAVENTAYHFDKTFDYLIPEGLEPLPQPGCRVMVPFGAGNKKRLAMVLSLSSENTYEKIKPIDAVLDSAPLLSAEGLAMVPWLKERYFCTLFEAAKLLIPAGVNLRLKTLVSLALPKETIAWDSYGEEVSRILRYLYASKKPVEKEKLLKTHALSQKESTWDRLLRDGVLREQSVAVRQVGDAVQRMVRLADPDGGLPKLTPKQEAVYRVLQDAGGVSVKELCYFSGVTEAVVKCLAGKGLVQCYEQEIYRNPYQEPAVAQQEPIVLSPEQETAFQSLKQKYRAGRGGVSLLYGVTGSGKTSVFLRLIDEAVQDGSGVIVMVPEISLTPQTITLFRARYGSGVAVFHSALSLAERFDEWKRVRRGEACVAVGTRSAVFAPFEKLGLVIMDEEQEYTYKSESAPRYHAREVARFRCAWHKAQLVLCSATPSMESYYLASTGRYGFERLTVRYGEATLPEVRVVDMNRELESGNSGIFSTELMESLQENLKIHNQSIILLNRRGYNTFVSCRSCEHVVTCPNCSISLTYHTANKRLMCHYCGYSEPFTEVCPECGEHTIRYAGFGTQRAEEQLRDLLPEARILRVDADTTMTRFAYDKKLNAFARGEYDIILGTQMVAKGLDFENVTLVGVLSADQTLYGDDFRSYERAFSLLTQVVGRSGRGRQKGKAIIQTFTPENEIFSLAARQDYPAFYERELSVRKAMLYPPFADICVIGFVGEEESVVRGASNAFLERLSALAQAEFAREPLRVLQPAPALVVKVSRKYRYRLIMKCRNSPVFRQMIQKLLQAFAKEKEYTGVTVFVDRNPDMVL